jgi:hypothetical protein
VSEGAWLLVNDGEVEIVAHGVTHRGREEAATRM